MSLFRWNTGALLVAGLMTVGRSPQLAAQDSTNAAVQQKLQDLDQQIKILGRRWELYQDSVIAAAKSRPSITAGSSGFQLKSADGNFLIKFRGYVQADGRFFLGDSAMVLTNDLLLRRVRPILEGTVYKYYDFRIMPDFAGSAPTIFDAYFEARFKPEFAVRAGKYKPALGLERYQSATDVKWIERGLPTNLVPSRDVGLQVSGDLAGGVINYNAGVFDGVPDLASGLNDIADGKDLVGRLFLVPFAKRGDNPPIDLGLGIAGSSGNELGTVTGTGLASYRSPGQATVFRYLTSTATPIPGTTIADGRRERIVPQAYLNKGPFGLLGEYAISRQAVSKDTGATRQTAKLEHKAWQVEGSFFLTGEKNSFKSVTPKKQFDPLAGGWGAWEIVARYGQLDFDNDAFPTFASPTASVSKETAWAVGLNWHLAKNLKVMVDFERTTFEGGAAANGDRPDEKFLGTRIQTAF
jgi:phosphate-selective porin OprO/OprP